MYPILFHLAGRPVHAYGTLLLVGFTFGYFMARWAFRRRGLKLALLHPMFAIAFITAILGSQILDAVVRLINGDNPLVGGSLAAFGLTEIGGMALAATSVSLYVRWKGESPLAYIDCFALGTILGLGFGRIGCFLAGCCYGRPTTLPWAVTFVDPHSHARAMLGVPVHPAQLYMAAAMWVLFAGLLVVSERVPGDGNVLIGLLTGYPIIRFIQEMVRADPYRGTWFGGVLTTYQLLSLALFLVMAPIAIRRYRRLAGSRLADPTPGHLPR